MADEETVLGLSLGFVLLSIAWVWGPSWIGFGCGLFGGVIVMFSGLSLFLAKVEHRRGD